MKTSRLHQNKSESQGDLQEMALLFLALLFQIRMGSCFSSAPPHNTVNGSTDMQGDKKHKAVTLSEGSKGAAQNVLDSPKRQIEGEDCSKTQFKSRSRRGGATESMNARSEMHPDEKSTRKQGGWSTSQEKPTMSHSVPKTSSVSQPKKPKKEEPAESKRKIQNKSSRSGKLKEVEPIADVTRGAEGDVEGGGGKDEQKAKEAGALEAHKEVENMEVSGLPETLGETHLEPKALGIPLPREEKAETFVEGGGSTVEEEDGEEDLYRAEEEIELDKNKKGLVQPLTTHERAAGAMGSSSVEAVVDLLHYSEREWRGNTAKSSLIRKGYKEVSQAFVGLRRVRGDNYCALRATLFQVFSQSTEIPSWLSEEDITLWPEQLLAEKEPIGQWQFPTESREEHTPEGAIEQLKHYMGVFRTRWEAAAQAGSGEQRQGVCTEVFRAEEEEYGLLEVLKFLMLRTAAGLHARMQSGEDVPVFCWLLFARDSSSCPRDFLLNHLSHVGVSGGLEQVEMFLLGYALQHTIKVYRLYKADTEEFITYYPDDHKKDWPCVCLLTEDDRHYNVPVSEAEGLQAPEAPTLG